MLIKGIAGFVVFISVYVTWGLLFWTVTGEFVFLAVCGVGFDIVWIAAELVVTADFNWLISLNVSGEEVKIFSTLDSFFDISNYFYHDETINSFSELSIFSTS